MARKLAKIDFTKEDPIYFSEAKRKIPGAPADRTVHRWYYIGLRSINGLRVKLEARLAPGGMATTMAAYRRFINKLNGE